VCASLSGTAPGTPLAPGYVMPLNFDSLTWTLISLVNTPVLANGFGTLPANGRAVATFNVPPGLAAPLAGYTIHFAATGVDPSFQFRFVTNARGLGILP